MCLCIAEIQLDRMYSCLHSCHKFCMGCGISYTRYTGCWGSTVLVPIHWCSHSYKCYPHSDSSHWCKTGSSWHWCTWHMGMGMPCTDCHSHSSHWHIGWCRCAGQGWGSSRYHRKEHTGIPGCSRGISTWCMKWMIGTADSGQWCIDIVASRST